MIYLSEFRIDNNIIVLDNLLMRTAQPGVVFRV